MPSLSVARSASDGDHPPLVLPRLRRRPREHRPGRPAGQRRPRRRGRPPTIRWRRRRRTSPPKAKRVIFLFMAGAPSHLELFDNKPQLAKFDGTLPPPELIKGYRAAFINPNSKLLGPKFKFAKHGQCGAELSELLPHLAEVVDDIAIVKSMVTDAFNHAPGADHDEHRLAAVRPAELRRLDDSTAWAASRRTCPASSSSAPARRGPAAATPTGAAASCRPSTRACSSAAAAIRCCTCPTRAASTPACSATRSTPSERSTSMRLDAVGDPEIATRINSFEMAYPHAGQRPGADGHLRRSRSTILEMYGAEPGKPSFANNCLLARRLLERGVRFVQLFHEAWDQHGNLDGRPQEELPGHRPGLRGPGQGPEAARTARRHAGRSGAASSAARRWCRAAATTAATIIPTPSPCGWPAAASSRASRSARPTTSASTSSRTASTSTTCTPRSCTCSGFDHTKLTYRFQGRDFRLTDVHGEVVQKLLA